MWNLATPQNIWVTKERLLIWSPSESFRVSLLRRQQESAEAVLQ